jgi:hypothetical protein
MERHIDYSQYGLRHCIFRKMEGVFLHRSVEEWGSLRTLDPSEDMEAAGYMLLSDENTPLHYLVITRLKLICKGTDIKLTWQLRKAGEYLEEAYLQEGKSPHPLQFLLRWRSRRWRHGNEPGRQVRS